MKKLYIFILIIFCTLSMYLYRYKYDFCKVFKIVTPVSFYADTNKNFIFDETETITIENFLYININEDYSNDEILSELTTEQKIFIQYKQNYIIRNLIKNKFVTFKNSQIYIDNKPLRKLLLDTNFFCENTKPSKEKLYVFISTVNLDDYVFLNPKTKKYHKINCSLVDKNNLIFYKLIKIKNLNKKVTPCKICHLKSKAVSFLPEKQVFNGQSETFSTDNGLKLFFLDLNKTYKPQNNCTSKACIALLNEINNAKNTIDFAIYGISSQDKIFNSLSNAQKRGVIVRWVCDYDKYKKNYYKDTLKLMKILKNYKSDKIYDENNRPAIMHNKFFIFDNQKVFTGSANISSTDFTEFNSNTAILINNKKIAEIFLNEFNQMYNGKFHTQKAITTNNHVIIDDSTQVDVFFSPQDKIISKQIIPILKSAKKYIYIPIFFLTRKELIPVLKEAHDKNIDIKIIIDANSSNSKYSIHNELRNYGIKVKVENYAGKMHSKTIIIDDKISIIGSMNFSNNGEKRNDENVLIIRNEKITKTLKSNFLYLWNKIPEKYLYKNIKAESSESIGSCFDTIDNDYDGKIDGDDEFCKQQN